MEFLYFSTVKSIITICFKEGRLGSAICHITVFSSFFLLSAIYHLKVAQISANNVYWEVGSFSYTTMLWDDGSAVLIEVNEEEICILFLRRTILKDVSDYPKILYAQEYLG